MESQDEISQIGMVYNQMADKVQNLIEKNYTLEIANREAEIEFLKMQINPHFLFYHIIVFPFDTCPEKFSQSNCQIRYFTVSI